MLWGGDRQRNASLCEEKASRASGWDGGGGGAWSQPASWLLFLTQFKLKCQKPGEAIGEIVDKARCFRMCAPTPLRTLRAFIPHVGRPQPARVTSSRKSWGSWHLPPMATVCYRKNQKQAHSLGDTESNWARLQWASSAETVVDLNLHSFFRGCAVAEAAQHRHSENRKDICLGCPWSGHVNWKMEANMEGIAFTTLWCSPGEPPTCGAPCSFFF